MRAAEPPLAVEEESAERRAVKALSSFLLLASGANILVISLFESSLVTWLFSFTN